MKKNLMKPFRAPRSSVDMRDSTAHRKDNSARFKEMEKWMDKNVTGEGAKTSAVNNGTKVLGLVGHAEQPDNPWWPNEPCQGEDVITTDQPCNGKEVMEEESPRISDTDDDDDNVPFAALLQKESHSPIVQKIKRKKVANLAGSTSLLSPLHPLIGTHWR